MKRQPTEWKKISANYATNKGLVPRFYKLFRKLNNSKTSNPVKKWAEKMSRYFSMIEIVSTGEEETKGTLILWYGDVNQCNHYGRDMKFLRNLKIDQTYDPAIPLLRICIKDMKSACENYMYLHVYGR